MTTALVTSHRELRVYQQARKGAYELAKLVETYPVFERYALANQTLRSTRSVYANLAEAWRRRRYKKYWVSKLNDCESEACETQEWIDTARELGYINVEKAAELVALYDEVLKGLVRMVVTADTWLIKSTNEPARKRRASRDERR